MMNNRKMILAMTVAMGMAMTADAQESGNANDGKQRKARPEVFETTTPPEILY